MKTLVLNASYEPVQLIDWQKAVYMIYTDKAEVVSTYDKVVRSVSQAIKLPKVIRLKNYVKLISNLTAVRYSRRNILLRDDHTCQYCGKQVVGKDATMDHVVPRSRGGKSTWTNVVTACHRCNNKKDNRTPKEAGMRLLNQPKRPKIANLLKEKLFEEFGLV